MNVGDLIKVDTGQTGLVIDLEYLYPGHPCSPVRTYTVLWNNKAPRWSALKEKSNISVINAFSVTKKINTSEIK